jgi:hypothetical protein
MNKTILQQQRLVELLLKEYKVSENMINIIKESQELCYLEGKVKGLEHARNN